MSFSGFSWGELDIRPVGTSTQALLNPLTRLGEYCEAFVSGAGASWDSYMKLHLNGNLVTFQSSGEDGKALSYPSAHVARLAIEDVIRRKVEDGAMTIEAAPL